MAFGVIVSAFLRTLGQLGDARFRRVLMLGIVLTLALLVGASAAVFVALQWAFGTDLTLPLFGPVTWLGDFLSWTSLFAMLGLSIFLMIPVASAITSMFLEDVADAVEARHYPHLPAARPVPFGEALRDTVNFLGVLIGANLMALFLYAIFSPLTPFIFYGMNGYLLGREYFTLAAMRREGRAGAREMLRANSLTVWAAGILMAIPLTVPIMNLVIPILGAASFTHIYHALRRDGEGPGRSAGRAHPVEDVDIPHRDDT
ncbi:EI24 domain-containing protein [Sediminimonas sp.]|uniref:EI24 domain-containing protein n=1 Tax=Sediminimonas sp. TaxID=2823379 RepID=UPI0025D7D0AB|nr:EI24 domain-containing protein [Sediminimonas sp.]